MMKMYNLFNTKNKNLNSVSVTIKNYSKNINEFLIMPMLKLKNLKTILEVQDFIVTKLKI